MKRPLLALAATAVMVLSTACVSDEGSQDPEPEVALSETVEEPTAASTEPLVLDYGELSGFEAVEEVAGPLLDHEQADVASYHLEGADPQEMIYIVTYRLEEDTTGWGFDEQSVISDTYDELTANESTGSSLHALIGGRESVFRYAVFRDEDDKYVYQWNTFVFDGFDMVHVTCQWRNERVQIQSGCQDLQTGFSLGRG